MANKINGIVVDIGGNTAPLQDALKGVNSTSRELQSELKQVEKLLKLDPSNVELVAQKQKLLADSIGNTETKLKALRQAETKAKQMVQSGDISENQYRAMQREIIATEQRLQSLQTQQQKLNSTTSTNSVAMQNLATEVSETTEELRENETQILSTTNRLKNFSDTMNKLGNTLTLGLTTPIIGIGTASVNSAIKFESAFAGVAKTVTASEEELAELEVGIREMAKTIPATAIEISKVAESAGQLGIQKESILGFSKVMVDLGESTNLSSDVASMSLAKFCNVMKMSQKDFEKLGSTIVDLGNNMATTEAEIVTMATRLAAAGTQIDLSEADVMALAATLSSVGIEAEAGGSSFSRVMLEMQMSVQGGEEAVADFAGVAKMSAKDFITLFKQDAVKAIQAFINGLSELENTAEVLEKLGLSEIRVRNALLSTSNASEVLGNALDIARNAWEENTALATESSKRYETTESKIKILKNTITDLAIELGDNFLPIIQDIAGSISEFANKFGELDKDTQETIIKFALLTASAGPILKVVGSLTSVIGGLGTAIGNAGGVSSLLAGSIGALATPLGGIALLIGATASVTYGFIKSQKEQREALINSKDSLDEMSEAYDTTYEKINNINDLVTEWKNLNSVINDNTTSAENLAIAKQSIAEIEEKLIENSDGIISRYDIENGKIAEKIELLKQQSEYELEFAKINLQQEVNNVDITKLQEENRLLEERKDILEEQALSQQEAYAKLKTLESEWKVLELRPQTEETLRAMDEIYAEAEKISSTAKIYISDIMLASEEANLRASETVDKLGKVTEEYNNSSESIETYYNTTLKVIELNLGGEYEVQSRTLGTMKDALDEVNFSGVVSNKTFELLKNILPDLSQNEADTSSNTNYLKQNIELLQEKVLSATKEIIGLNKEITGLPDEKKIDVQVAISGTDSLKQLMLTIGTYQEKLNNGGLTLRESREYVKVLDELERRQKPTSTTKTKESNGEPVKRKYDVDSDGKEKSKKTRSNKNAEKEAEKQ